MSDARVEYILAHSDPLDVANAVQSTVESLSWETFYEVASHGRSRLAGSYREELNEVLALDPPYVREEFYNFLKRNPRALGSFGSPFITRVASRLESSSPPLFGDTRGQDRRRALAYAAAIAAAFVLGVAITVFVTHSRGPLQAASRKISVPTAPVHFSRAAHKQQNVLAHPVRRRTDEVVSEETPLPQTPAPSPQQSVAPVVVHQAQHSPSPAPSKAAPNGKGDAVVAIPQPSPTATPQEDPIDAESGTPVWRKGTVNVQASAPPPPDVQGESVPHESKAIPVRTATPPPPKPKATQKPGLVKRVINVFKGHPAPSPSASP